MPSIKDQSTVEAIAREYCSNGRNKTEALKAVRYSKSYCEGGRSAEIVWGNERVKQAIADIDAKSAEKAEFTLQAYQAQLQDDRQLAIELKQPSAAVSASVAMGRSCGFDKDMQASPDTPQDLTSEELTDLHRRANLALSTDTTSQDGDREVKQA